MSVKFLIVTSVLDGARFLQSTLDSVSAQTWRHWRHLIIDAGSSDGSLEIARRHADTEDRAQVVHQPGVGLYDALLTAFETRKPEEEILCWLNADDLYAPWSLESAARVFSEPHEPAWITGLPGVWDEAGRLRAVSPTGWCARRLIEHGWRHDGALGCIQQESTFFRSALFDSLSSEEREHIRSFRLAGDFALWRALAKRSRLHVTPTVLGGFRVHGSNRSLLDTSAYSDEVRAAGGVILPGWFARRARSLYDLAGAIAVLRASRRAQYTLHAEVRSQTDSDDAE